jgi:hypothetical protein
MFKSWAIRLNFFVKKRSDTPPTKPCHYRHATPPLRSSLGSFNLPPFIVENTSSSSLTTAYNFSISDLLSLDFHLQTSIESRANFFSTQNVTLCLHCLQSFLHPCQFLRSWSHQEISPSPRLRLRPGGHSHPWNSSPIPRAITSPSAFSPLPIGCISSRSQECVFSFPHFCSQAS